MKIKLLILSGLSGSGKSVALRTLEDLGYYCIDNLPLFLLKTLALNLLQAPGNSFAQTGVGVDARTGQNELWQIPQLVNNARSQGVDCRVIFLDAQSDTLIRRFSATRRRHPLTRGNCPLREAIEFERGLLEPIQRCADICIDTTNTNVHELRARVCGWLVGGDSSKASILLQSFGFKHGVPQDVDFVFDVRCLANPHWEPTLQSLTGRDPQVIEFLNQNSAVRRMRADILSFFERWIPCFETDGRSYLTIAIGCTGGQHRSVYMTEELRRHFEGLGHTVMVRHRELP